MEMQMEFIRKLPTPQELKQEFPLTENIKKIKEERDQIIENIFTGKDEKKYAIVGLQPRSYKHPLCIVDVDDGRRYQADRRFIKEWSDSFYAETIDQKCED